MIQEVFLAIFKFYRYLFLTSVRILKCFLQELNFLFKQCFLFVELRLSCNLLPLNFFFIIFSSWHFCRQLFNLSFKFSFLLGYTTIKFLFKLNFFTLNLLKMFASTLFFGWHFGLFNFSSSKFSFELINFFLYFSLIFIELRLKFLYIFFSKCFMQIHFIDCVS